MRSFQTRCGRCVIEHGEIHLESIGIRGRVKRSLKNTKRKHEKRYERGKIWFMVVFLFGLFTFGGFVYRVLFGDTRTMVLGFGFAAAVIGAVYGLLFIRRFIGRRFQGFTDERTIPVRTIESVESHPKELFRRAHFVIHYDEYGTKKKRYVGVCGLTPLAEDEFETAKAIFFDEGDLSITPA